MYKRLLGYFSLFLLPIYGHAVADKQLDAFTSTNLIYSAFNPGTAGSSMIATIDNTVGNYAEGTSSLKYQYTFNATAGGFIEGFRSYGSNTLDLSFSPDMLTLNVKGSAANPDKITIMLYEDLDMDGTPGETGEEIFESSSFSVGSTWTTINIPFSSMTLFAANGGNAQLNLNRIYAWRIKIINQTGTAHTATIWVDDLRQVTTYTPFSTGSALLTGAYFQLWNSGAGCSCGQWTQAEWDAELLKLKNAGQTKVFVQYGVWETNAWYSGSAIPGYVSNPTLDRIFTSAESLGMKVVVGLYFSESWNTDDKTLAATYSTLLTKDQQVADEIWTKFGSSVAFEGWYIPQELNDLEWRNGSTQQTLLFNWLKGVSDYVKAKSSSKKVYIAPFFGPNRPADDLQNWYTAMLTTATNIDVVIPQDGIGTTRVDGDVDVPLYFNAINTAVVAKGKIFGATIESFHQTDGWPVNTNSFAAVPASISTFTSQLWEAGAYATELVQFEYPYMQGSRGATYQQFYNDYLNYYQQVVTLVLVERKNEVLVYPVPTAAMVQMQWPSTGSVAYVSVYMVSGEKAIEINTTANECQLDLSTFKKGMYMVKVRTENNVVYTGRIILQ